MAYAIQFCHRSGLPLLFYIIWCSLQNVERHPAVSISLPRPRQTDILRKHTNTNKTLLVVGCNIFMVVTTNDLWFVTCSWLEKLEVLQLTLVTTIPGLPYSGVLNTSMVLTCYCFPLWFLHPGGFMVGLLLQRPPSSVDRSDNVIGY